MLRVQGSRLAADEETVAALAGLLGARRNSSKLTMLFDTHNSGWNNPADFHSSCDDKGPTIVLIRSSDGKSYGGYTSVSWASNASFREDPHAFLFRMWPEAGQRSGRCVRTEKFAVTDPTYAQSSSASQGPTFGRGNDLQTFTTGGLKLSMSPNSYPTGTSGVSGALINSFVPKNTSNFQLEVLQVTVGTGELEMPWLAGLTWTLEESKRLQREVFEFSPAAEGVPPKNINLLLCGGVGAGKSSIVSTIDSLCQGRVSRRAPHGQGTGSLTRQLRKYEFINPASKKKVQWQVWDSMGWGATDYKKGELGFILDGNLPNKCKLDGSITLKTDGFNANPSIADAVHCMCLVVPCDAASDDSYMARLREMRQFARDREIPTLVFLTMIDTYDPDVIGQDVKKTFHSERLLSLMEELEDSSGVGGRKDILPIKNLSSEMEPTAEARILVCRALQQALYAAVDYLRECDDMEMTEDDELA